MTEKELEEIDVFLQTKGILFAGNLKPFRFTDDGETLSVEQHTDDEQLVVGDITIPKGKQ